MKDNLLLNALVKLCGGFALVAALLFLPAGTFHFWNAWLFIGVYFIPMSITGLVLLLKSPELLKKRLRIKENEPAQKVVIALSLLMFVGGFIIAALDFRFGWSKLPIWAVIAAAGVFLLAYALYAEVIRENAYLSRVVEVQENQQVIDTGLYGIIRHPMYFATLLLFLCTPLMLGSLWAFLVFLIYPFLIVKRIRNEEALLEKELTGYPAYCQKVKYRLIPFIW